MSLCQKEHAFYKQAGDYAKTEFGSQILRLGDIAIARASALLTHVSIMIAVLGLFAVKTFDKSEWSVIDYLIAFEFCAYLIISLGCLIPLYITSPTTFKNNDFTNDMAVLIIRRRKIFSICVRATTIATITFVITLAVKIAVL